MRRGDTRPFILLAVFVLVMAAWIFGFAGTLDYPSAWIFLATYSAASLALTLDLRVRDPALLERRMRGGPFAEREPAQKIIMAIASLGFMALGAVPAIDRRLGWSHLPMLVSLVGDGLVLLGFVAIRWVFAANSFAAATIEVAPGQTVVSSGPYAYVRHPMYAAGLVLFVGVPVALGSFYGELPLAAVVPALAWRILDEERLLARDLAGYSAYMREVQTRIVPGLW